MVDPLEGSSAKEKDGREKHKYQYGICRIWRKSEGGQSHSKALGTGFLVQGLITPKCSFQICLVTSDKVVAGCDYKNYLVEFRKCKSALKMTKIELSEIASSDFHRTSGLNFIGISIDLIKTKKKKFYKDISCRLFDVVKERVGSYEDLFCYFVDDSQAEVWVKQMEIRQNDRMEFYAKDALRTYSTFSQFTHGNPHGGVILKTIENELVVVGMLQFTNNETVSPVFFPISSSEGKREMLPNPGATEIENGGTSSENGMMTEKQHDLRGNVAVDNQHHLQSNQGKGKMPLNHFTTGIENGVTALKKEGQQEHTLQFNQGERDDQCATETENGRTASPNGVVVEEKQNCGGNLMVNNQHLLQSNQGSTSGSGGSDWLSYLKSWLPFQDNSDSCSDDGNLSLKLSGICSFDIAIDPSEIPLKGGGPCHFFFIPDLPSDISSGTAKFFGLLGGFVKLKGVKDEADCLVGRGIPSAEKEGWVTVEVWGKNDKTGESNNLGQTKIYYFDEHKRVLKQIVQNAERCHDFFKTWKTAYEGHSTASRVTKTESPSSGSMDSDNPLHSLQGLMLLVYTAAETDARQFIELIFNSSAGRVVFNAYRCNSPLPEDVARAFGHEDTAQYLESISKRFSEDLSINEEDLQASHILELAEAVKNQSKLPKPLPTPEQAARTKPSPHAPSQESGDDIDYKVKSGYVLVIHNFIFSKRQDSARHGSEQDVKNLISLFDDFNFKTRMVEIFTQSQMVDILNETAEKDFSRYDCFLCIIFSHGLKDGIYGTDEEVIKIEAVTSFFRRDACPSLEGKPKIFLIQACRGTQQDRVPIESDSEPVPYASSSLPADADFLICFASALSSWFISTVVAIFKEYAEREHLMDMMLRVNDRLAQFYSKGGLKQIPCQICTLRRKVYLSPRYNTS